ncbi:methionine ABC transporter permease [Clostridioides difficile]
MDNPSLVINKIIIPAVFDTIYMVTWATVISSIIGFILAIILVETSNEGLSPNKYIYKILDLMINIIRSFPFIILAVSITPITRFVVGTSIGKQAAMLPLIIVASPFIARLIESNLREVDKGMIEAAKSFGASNLQILFSIMFREAIPSICSSITLATVSILGSSAMAGALGAGGLGSVALIYGYQTFNDTIMYGTVIIIIIMVQVIQTVGNVLYKKLK